MAIFYVKTGGNDSLDGLSEANAWATPTKAFATVLSSVSDTVYVASGTYRNTSGWTITNNGASSRTLNFIGDINAEHFANEEAGYVRLTGCDSSELPAVAGYILDLEAKDYMSFSNIVFDGTATGGDYIGIGSNSRTSNINVESCIVQSSGNCIGSTSTPSIVTVNKCLLISSRNSAQNILVTESILISSNIAGVGLKEGSYGNIMIAGGTGASGGYSSNSLSIGCTRGFSNVIGKNNLAICGGSYPISGGTNDNSISMAGEVSSFGTNTNCKELYSFEPLNTGITASNHIGYTNINKIMQLAQALKPDLFFEKNNGDDSATVGTTDILGNPRRQGDGTIDASPWAFEDRSISFGTGNSSTNEVQIDRKGTELLEPVFVKAEEYTVTCKVKHNSTTNKPSLTATSKAGSITTQTSTATGAGSTFEQLSVTFTPSFEDQIEIRLNGNDTTVAAYAWFSDIQVTK